MFISHWAVPFLEYLLNRHLEKMSSLGQSIESLLRKKLLVAIICQCFVVHLHICRYEGGEDSIQFQFQVIVVMKVFICFREIWWGDQHSITIPDSLLWSRNILKFGVWIKWQQEHFSVKITTLNTCARALWWFNEIPDRARGEMTNNSISLNILRGSISWTGEEIFVGKAFHNCSKNFSFVFGAISTDGARSPRMAMYSLQLYRMFVKWCNIGAGNEL